MSDPREALARFIRWVMRDVTYCRTYSAVVVRDNGDGTVDVLPDDPEMPSSLGFQRVRVGVGIAGAGVIAEPGTRCLFGFDDKDPRRPVVSEWAYARNTGYISLDEGHAGLARVAELVDVLLPVGTPTPIVGIASGVTVVPGTPPVTIPIPPTPFAGTATLAGFARGSVLSGAARVKA